MDFASAVFIYVLAAKNTTLVNTSRKQDCDSSLIYEGANKDMYLSKYSEIIERNAINKRHGVFYEDMLIYKNPINNFHKIKNIDKVEVIMYLSL